MRWDSIHQNDWRVKEASGWRYWDNFDTLKPVAGVYLFANVDLQIKYIGKAGPGRMVDKIRSAINRGKAFGATRVKGLYTKSGKNAITLEKDLIEIFDPPNNFK